jgi:hypothetical protein
MGEVNTLLYELQSVVNGLVSAFICRDYESVLGLLEKAKLLIGEVSEKLEGRQ